MSTATPKKQLHPPALVVLVVSLMVLVNSLGCFIVGPMFGLAGPGMGVAAWYEAEHHKALDERGVDCPGEVVEATEYYDSDGFRRVRVSYEYDCGSGVYSDDFSESYSDDWPPGTAVDIEALPEDPEHHRRLGESSAAPFLAVAGGILSTMGACACIFVLLLVVLVVWSAKNLYRPVVASPGDS